MYFKAVVLPKQLVYQGGHSTKSIILLSGQFLLKIIIKEAISFTHLRYWGSDVYFVSSTTFVVLTKQLFHQGVYFKMVFFPKRLLHQNSRSTKQTLSFIGQKYEVIIST